MSERILILTQFNSVSIRTSNIRMVEFEDTGDQSISRIITLSNGTKYDIDGTADSDTTLGQTIAVFSCIGTAKGFNVTNTAYRTLANLRGKSATLQGVTINYEGTEVVYQCTARLLIVRPRRLKAGQDTPLAQARRTRVFAECIWERKTEWAAA